MRPLHKASLLVAFYLLTSAASGAEMMPSVRTTASPIRRIGTSVGWLARV
jgi:hypothetical protein